MEKPIEKVGDVGSVSFRASFGEVESFDLLPFPSMTALLRRAVWQNDLETVESLLERNPSHVLKADDESGWTVLHSALYFGHLRIAARLWSKGSSLDVLDVNDRSPLELISKELPSRCTLRTDVFSWGSGTNFQLGTGNNGTQLTPRRIESLTNHKIVDLAASKFHSMALSEKGQVYTWGWASNGRLGHSESQFRSNHAQIFPRIVNKLIDLPIVAIAAAKHHSIAVTATGVVFSWGYNPDGRLGYASNNNRQSTPKRIMALKGIHVQHVATANKHTVVVTTTGVVYTWGSNVYGQLGYGVIDSASNPNPMPVEALRAKRVIQVAAAKKHSLALTEDGIVFSWGHQCVAPKRMVLVGSRDREATNKTGMPIQFHRGLQKVKKPVVIMIAAGAIVSSCLLTTGSVLCWLSCKPENGMKEVGGKLSGKKVVSISAAKTTTTAVLNDGRAYCWEPSLETELVPGVKNATKIVMGEKHGLALQKWNAGRIPEESVGSSSAASESGGTFVCSVSVCSEMDLEGNSFECFVSKQNPYDPDLESASFECLTSKQKKTKPVPFSPSVSLQLLCEKAVAKHVLDPRTAIGLFRYADTTGSEFLKTISLQLIVDNLTLIWHESAEALASLSDDLLLEIEEKYQKEVLNIHSNVGDNWWQTGHRPDQDLEIWTKRPTYQFPHETINVTSPKRSSTPSDRKTLISMKANRFVTQKRPLEKILQTTKKKLQQIESLQEKEAKGVALDEGQRAKMARKPMYEKALKAIEQGASYEDVLQCLNEAPTKTKSTSLNSSVLKEPHEKPKPKPSPNLLPVFQPPPKSRDVGHMPRFLEPARNQTSKPVKKASFPPKPPPKPCEDIPSSKEKKWLTLEMEATEPKQNAGRRMKALPLKEFQKASIEAILHPPIETPQPPVKAPPAWSKKPQTQSLSFRSIQEEQRNYRPGFQREGPKPVVERRRTVHRWQIYSDVQIQSIPHIQIEEKAVQELTALYKGATVRVRTGTARSAKPAEGR